MKRSPATAVLLSLLPGAGHIYVGQVDKGILLVVLLASTIQMVEHGAEGFGIVIAFIWLYAMLDAHRAAVEVNRVLAAGGEPPRYGTAVAKWWGYVLIVLGVLFTLNNFGVINFEWIWQLWPLGLVAVGVFILRRKPEERSTLEAPIEASHPPLEVPEATGDSENA